MVIEKENYCQRNFNVYLVFKRQIRYTLITNVLQFTINLRKYQRNLSAIYKLSAKIGIVRLIWSSRFYAGSNIQNEREQIVSCVHIYFHTPLFILFHI